MLALAAAPPVPPAPPARVLTFADEFRFGTSRRVVPAGPVLLQLKNIGEDEHDLRLVGPRGAARAETGEVEPDGVGRFRVRLAKGRYTFYCTVADHDVRGMTGTLIVKPRRRAAR
jgi:hypothetical protein